MQCKLLGPSRKYVALPSVCVFVCVMCFSAWLFQECGWVFQQWKED